MSAALGRVTSEPHFGERAGAVEAEIAALADMDAAVAALEAMA